MPFACFISLSHTTTNTNTNTHTYPYMYMHTFGSHLLLLRCASLCWFFFTSQHLRATRFCFFLFILYHVEMNESFSAMDHSKMIILCNLQNFSAFLSVSELLDPCMHFILREFIYPVYFVHTILFVDLAFSLIHDIYKIMNFLLFFSLFFSIY